MNLNESPTLEQLKELIVKCNDRRAGHILYAKTDSEVRIKAFPNGINYGEWVDDNPDAIQMRFEYYHPGHGYVGPLAVQKEQWVERIFAALLRDWGRKSAAYPSYIDFY